MDAKKHFSSSTFSLSEENDLQVEVEFFFVDLHNFCMLPNDRQPIFSTILSPKNVLSRHQADL